MWEGGGGYISLCVLAWQGWQQGGKCAYICTYQHVQNILEGLIHINFYFNIVIYICVTKCTISLIFDMSCN